jgi:hypothetical protein
MPNAQCLMPNYMKLNAHFYLLNDDFSPEYAEANFNGQESENNPLYEWEDELDVNDVKNIEIIRKGEYPLRGEFESGSFEFNLPNMFLVVLELENGQQGAFAVSESILDSYKHEGNRLEVFLKDYEPMSNPIPGVYIAAKEFPKELIRE